VTRRPYRLSAQPDAGRIALPVRHELFLRPDQLTFTFRNKLDQTALPIRNWGAFMPPNGVGGGGVHWNAENWRFLPSDFVIKTHLTQRYDADSCRPT
jgi:gluconate 2-dehydrogenase alpha chain